MHLYIFIHIFTYITHKYVSCGLWTSWDSYKLCTWKYIETLRPFNTKPQFFEYYVQLSDTREQLYENLDGCVARRFYMLSFWLVSAFFLLIAT